MESVPILNYFKANNSKELSNTIIFLYLHNNILKAFEMLMSGEIILMKNQIYNLQETIFLAEHGVDKVIKERETDNSGWTDVDDIDWNKL